MTEKWEALKKYIKEGQERNIPANESYAWRIGYSDAMDDVLNWIEEEVEE